MRDRSSPSLWFPLLIGLLTVAACVVAIVSLDLGPQSEGTAVTFVLASVVAVAVGGCRAGVVPLLAGAMALSGLVNPWLDFGVGGRAPWWRIFYYVLLTGTLCLLQYRRERAHAEAERMRAESVGLEESLRKESERRRVAEQKTAEQARSLETTLAGILDAVISTDANGVVTYVNRAAGTILNCPPEDCLGQQLRELLIVEDESTGERLPPLAYRVLNAGTPLHDEASRILVLPEGTRIPVEVTAAPLHDETGRITSVVTILRDAREKRAAQQALRDSEERFRVATEAGNLGVWVWELGSDKVNWNAALARMVGVADTEYCGHVDDFLSRVHAEDMPSLQRALRETIERECGFYHEFRIVLPGGTMRWLMGTGRLIADRDGLRPSRFAGVNIDITDRKLAEDQIRTLNQDLEQLATQLAETNQRLRERTHELEEVNEAKTQFLSSMSHELRTPLNTICGFTELLLEQQIGTLNDRQHRYLRNIDTSAQHLIRVVSDVLDLSKIAAGRLSIEMSAQDVCEMLEEVVSSFGPMADELQIGLDCRAPDALRVAADPRRLRQILINLVSNALRFTPAGGNVCVEASPQEREVCIAVKDNGIGIPAEKQEAIFREFEQVHQAGFRPSQRGSGLGLAITRRLVELHHGRIEVESEVGKGSEFRVYLPSAEAAAVVSAAP